MPHVMLRWVADAWVPLSKILIGFMLGCMRILHVTRDVNVAPGRMGTAVEDGEAVYVGFNVIGHATCDVTLMGRGHLGTAVEILTGFMLAFM